jgi:enediyne polyketide synthase
VERIAVYGRPDGRLTLDARQRDEDGDGFVFDVTISDAGRSVVEEWRGLALRAIGPVELTRWPVELLGPYLTRTLRRWRPEVAIDLAVAPADRTDRYRTRAVATWLAGTAVEHAADGRLVAAGPASISASHMDDRVLVAAGGPGAGHVAVDWERVTGAPALGEADEALAGELGRSTGEEGPVAAFRVWTCHEVLAKRGLAPDAPLVLDGSGPAGWVRLTSGGYPLYSAVVETTAGTIAVCVGAG